MNIEHMVMDIVCQKMGVTRNDISSITRRKNTVIARRILYGILRKLGVSLPSIGGFVGRDHTTVIHSLTALEHDPILTTIVESGYQQIQEKIERKRKELNGEYPPTEMVPISRHGEGFSKKNLTRWQKIYEKYGGKCCVCGFTEVVEVHHIISRSMGGTDEIENLILVCPNHHALIERGMIFIKDIHKKFEDYPPPNKDSIS